MGVAYAVLLLSQGSLRESIPVADELFHLPKCPQKPFNLSLQIILDSTGYTLKRPGAEDVVVTRVFSSLDGNVFARKELRRKIFPRRWWR